MQTSATSYHLADGVLTFYFAPSQNPGSIAYDVHGYLPGQYRALPATIRSAYEPGRFHLGPVNDLRVRAPGEPSTDPYKPTPDELFALGKAHFDAGRIAEAGERARATFRRLHAPRRHRQRRGPHAALDQYSPARLAENRAVLRGRQGKGARAGPYVRPVACDRQGVSRHQRI